MAMRYLILGCLVHVAAGCGGLDEGDARAQIDQRLREVSGGACVLTMAKDGTYTDVDHLGVRECVEELSKAGIAHRGACRDPGPEGPTCNDRLLVADGTSSHTNEGLAFRCGAFELRRIDEIERVSTDEARVTYLRDFSSPVLRELPHCTNELTIHHPEEGETVRTVDFRRVDGKWLIGDQEPLRL
ncbi:MAG: hypothetical protein R3B72_27395 [Polyangiaceae bacterium]